MNDAPEKIFASPDHEDGWRWPRASQFPEQGPYQNVPYLRADLPATRAQIAASPEVRALVEAVEKMRRSVLPVWLTIKQEEMAEQPMPDDAVILHFMGSGMSDMVTVGEFNAAMSSADTALAAFKAMEAGE